MTAQVSGIQYQRIRAPRGHGESLVTPRPLSPAALVSANRQRFHAAATTSVGRVPFDSLREEARQGIVRLAYDFTQQYRDVGSLPDTSAPLILSGHQPALYHPGVWFKNFLIDRIATNVSGTAINVIVDNDTAPAPSISALSGTPGEPRPARIAYDEPGPQQPWEMTTIHSLEMLRSFSKRTVETFGKFVADPMIVSFWPDVLAAIEAGKPLGQAFSQARNQLEAEFGLNVLDVPLSQLCQTRWFLTMVGGILEEAGRYREIYNACVNEYRMVHGIRSTSHPVPNLGAEGNWIEVPFWMWTEENPRRRPLWIAHKESGIRLSDRGDWHTKLASDGDLVTELQSLRACRVYVRPRALATTTVLRLAASDLFIHGIGGAKYDQVTDEIIRRFYFVQPPQFVTATASALLPIPRPQATEEDLLEIKRKLRDADFNPERVVDEAAINAPDWASLVAQKSDLLENIPTLSEKSSWHRQLQEVNAAMRERITEPVARLRIERDQVAQQLQQESLLASREFPFILFPKDGLRNLLLDLAVKEL
ncbi:hypothetical protein DTL21_16855 [Bremerella cremea]|uniref:Uncharacterized protein n=1 Tax=Blastopirellula marina TaxID=124 RepID=A0A2S8FIF7_9BACT|nr:MULTISPECIES: hypothetical protein [Pirellulaceae]PQO31923.1 hypothetical protein C5Y83_16840 [Blastopirellula marina]RCS44989.1 hypothetical protein DTL21_16855 [Bremerella cremea]